MEEVVLDHPQRRKRPNMMFGSHIMFSTSNFFLYLQNKFHFLPFKFLGELRGTSTELEINFIILHNINYVVQRSIIDDYSSRNIHKKLNFYSRFPYCCACVERTMLRSRFMLQ